MWKLLKAWGIGIVAGLALSTMLNGERVITTLNSAANVISTETPLLSVFIKNSLASLTTIFLGVFLCMAELQIYRGVEPETYSFLEKLTDPLYILLGKIYSPFQEARPFFRSCLFYLLSIPLFSLLINGFVLGFLGGFYFREGNFTSYLSSLYPHAILEIPALFASGAIGLKILGILEKSIQKADFQLFEENVRSIISPRIISAVFLIQCTLFISALLEVG
jgi:uncharacterized membrane protein SpoIIM required for sporulation